MIREVDLAREELNGSHLVGFPVGVYAGVALANIFVVVVRFSSL